MQNLSLLGAPITLDDCGFYIAHNRATNTINSLFNLRYKNDNWWLSQLKHIAATDQQEEAIFWQALGGASDNVGNNLNSALQSMPTAELQQWLQQPELQDPPGGWQVLRNAHFGFGKFTPIDKQLSTSYALLRFRDGQMLGPILIEKTIDPAIMGEIGF
jgi:hypothetical protein